MSRFDEGQAEPAGDDAAGAMPRGASRRWSAWSSTATTRSPGCCWASLAMTVLEALPDVLVGVWLALVTDGLVHHHQTRLSSAPLGLAVSGDPDVGAVGHPRPHHAAAGRPAQHHVPGPRRPAPGRGRHRRAPRAAGLPRPHRGAAHRRVRPRPPVPVDVHDGRLAAAAGVRVRAARRHPPRCSCSCWSVRSRCSWWRSWRPKVEKRVEERVAVARPARPPPVHASRPHRHRARRCGSPATRPTSSRDAVRPGAAGSARSAPPSSRARVAGAGLGGVLGGVRRRGGVGRHRPRPRARCRGSGADRRRPALRLRRLGGRRARLPARHLARLGPAPRLAGGLRRRAERRTPTSRPPSD